MTDQIRPDDPQDLWQNQEPEEMTITLAEVRARAVRLHRKARFTLITSLIGLLVLVILPAMSAMNRPRLIPWAIWAIVILLLFYPNYRTYKAGRMALGDTGVTASVEFYRHELERRAKTPRAIILFLGVTVWAALLVVESRRPLAAWIPFFVILAIAVIAAYFNRRHEVQGIKADLEELNRLTAKEL